MDSSTYGSMVECGPESARVGQGEFVSVATGMRATYALLTLRRRPGAGGALEPALGSNWLDPDDGCAGVPARV
jgi:hypothetical protein